MGITLENVSESDIDMLQVEAAASGDIVQLRICHRARLGEHGSIRQIAWAMRSRDSLAACPCDTGAFR